MAFQEGNTEHEKADRKKPRVIAQQLISALHELHSDEKPKIRKIVDALIEKAMAGDTIAIKEIMDRVDGKVPQPVGGSDDLPPHKLEISWKTGSE